jgi:hypothetical protein
MHILRGCLCHMETLIFTGEITVILQAKNDFSIRIASLQMIQLIYR